MKQEEIPYQNSWAGSTNATAMGGMGMSLGNFNIAALNSAVARFYKKKHSVGESKSGGRRWEIFWAMDFWAF